MSFLFEPITPTHIKDIQDAFRANGIEAALRCGQLLHEARLRTDHGDWAGWLAQHFPGSHRSANQYMQIAQAHRHDPDLFEQHRVDNVASAIAAIHRAAGIERDMTAGLALKSGIAPNQSAVYFIESGPDGPIKVGVVHQLRSLPNRMQSIQTGSPYPLRVVALMPGGQPLETILHRRLIDHRLCGEWFEREPVLAVIASHAEDTNA